MRLGEESGEETPSEMRDRPKGMKRKRHLMVWGDNSTLLNHGHLLLSISTIYDEAIYYTNEQMKAKGKENIDVQSLVESPHVYMLGRCGASEVEQLAYVKTREACFQSVSEPVLTSNGVQIIDIMRVFHGDGPQQEFEAGEQKSGNAGCASCSGDAGKYKDLDVSLRRPHLGLSERFKKVLQGPAAKNRRNGGLKPFNDLRKEELKR